MKWHDTDRRAGARHGVPQRGAVEHGRVIVWRGLLGALLSGTGAVAQTLPAPPTQDAPVVPPLISSWGPGAGLGPGRLTVRPRTMATGTRTARAGRQPLDSFSHVEVYVPPQCVGTRRCPLFVHLQGELKLHAQQADKYGMIVLQYGGESGLMGSLINNRRFSVDPAVPDLVRELPNDLGTRELDAVLTQVLRTFAIDPAKIAVTGNSNYGSETMFLGRNNPDVFSRVLPTSPAGGGSPIFEGAGPPDTTVQFYVSGGVAEEGFFRNALEYARAVRQDGMAAKIVLEPRPHTWNTPEDAAAMWHWLHESWAAPEATRRAARQAAQRRPVDSGPLLTDDALTRWTTFWTRFMQEPDSIRLTARVAHVKEFPALVGQEPVALLMTDLPALAAQYPSVTADLQAAGLSARQAQADRLALLSACITLWLELAAKERSTVIAPVIGMVAPGSVLGKNMAFLAARLDQQAMLRASTTADNTSWIGSP